MTEPVREKYDESVDGSPDNTTSVLQRKGLAALYYHPTTQIVMLGFVCFMCPGLYNALSGLGGGGQVTPTTADNASSALYATSALMAFFGGSVNNKLGSRLTLLLGTTGYPLYIGSFLALNNHPSADGFVIAAGAILGICAGLLWTAQGSLMLAYPIESMKGRYISIFWAIFNLGGVVGAAVTLRLNFYSTANAVGNGTYIAFLVLTLIAVCIPMTMANPDKMYRVDGTRVVTIAHSSWKKGLLGLWITLRTDPMIILLFSMFFTSNYFYTWQFSDYNAALFNIRARSLNSFIYWTSQIVGSAAIGILLDQDRLRRRLRAFAGWTILFGMVWIAHIWAYFYQKDYTRESVDPKHYSRMDIYDSDYPTHIWLYIFCGLLDSMWQTTAYWLIGAMSNDPAKLAYLTGFYKSIQCAGGAGAWRADGVGIPYMNIFISTWVLLVVGLLFVFPVVYLRIKDHTDRTDEAPLAELGQET